MNYIHHVTLNTGHARGSPRAEVSAQAVEVCDDLLTQALLGKRPVVPSTPYLLNATGRGRCVLASIFAGERPVLTLAIAQHSRCGAPLWRALHETAQRLKTNLGDVPHEPWCAVRLDSVTPQDFSDLQKLADFERCLAWAWIERW